MTSAPAPTGTPAAAAVEDADGTVTHGDLAADVWGLRRRVPAGAVVALRARRARTVAAAFAALDGWAGRVDLFGGLTAPGPEAGAVVLDDAVTASREVPAGPSPADPPERVPTRWRLFTSGTTGEPKAVDHTVASLTRTTVRPAGTDRQPRRWGLLYEPTRMAGVQVLLQTLSAGDHLLDATAGGSLPERLAWLADRSVEALSATPTVWRQVLQSADPRALPLRQITLGGEIADQRVLDGLARTFPDARITHVFASTETGAAFAVNDGREGFPVGYLESAPKGVRLEVRDGVLFVAAPGVSGAGEDSFVSTGDLVVVTGDRVRFLGRASGVVNVGGVTVAPEQVEATLRAHDAVADVVVRPRRNPFSGWILTADVVPADGADREGLSRALRAHVGELLSSAHVPASLRIVDALTTSVTGKATRR